MTEKETRAFVDALESESESARLLVGEESFTVPRSLLPPDAFEGSWLRIVTTLLPRPPDDDTDQRRRRLGSTDPGGDIRRAPRTHPGREMCGTAAPATLRPVGWRTQPFGSLLPASSPREAT